MALFPLPRSVATRPDPWRWSGELVVDVLDDAGRRGEDCAHVGVVERLSAPWAERAGRSWRLERPRQGEPALRCALRASLGERYRLVVDASGASIEAGSAQATQWALLTLGQLLPARLHAAGPGEPDSEIVVPGVVIEDAPAFAWRGVHLDVARHFFEVPVVERFVELAASLKCNVLHLHLSDDQGWRLEVPALPRLTEVGAWRSSSPLGHESEGLDDGVPHGGFYRSEDVARLVDFARERFVTIVPEIDLPGHVQALVAAYPELGNTGRPVPVATRWGISEHVLNLEEATFALCERVLAHVAELFPGPYIHIGGDECPSTQWAESPRARERMAELGVSDPRRVQQLFTRRLGQFVTTLPLADPGPLGETRRRALAWDEVLDGDVEPSTIIAAWRHSSEGARAARAGFDVVMAPMQFTYFDWPQSDDPAEPVGLTRPPWPTTLEQAQRFCAMPPGLEDAYRERILGAQAQHWSEYIASPEHLEYMALPRLVAFAESVWRGQPEGYRSFAERLGGHLERLDAAGVRYRAPGPALTDAATPPAEL